LGPVARVGSFAPILEQARILECRMVPPIAPEALDDVRDDAGQVSGIQQDPGVALRMRLPLLDQPHLGIARDVLRIPAPV
jgi:hypothetical protein